MLMLLSTTCMPCSLLQRWCCCLCIHADDLVRFPDFTCCWCCCCIYHPIWTTYFTIKVDKASLDNSNGAVYWSAQCTYNPAATVATAAASHAAAVLYNPQLTSPSRPWSIKAILTCATG
jgi:hypothetical protein